MESYDYDMSDGSNNNMHVHDIENRLLYDLYQLFFRKDLYVFGISAVDYFLSKSRRHTHVIDVCADDDRHVHKIINKLINVLSFSFNIYIRFIKDGDPECACPHSDHNVEDISVATIDLEYKHIPGICFHVNVHQGPLDELDMIFDIDSICVLGMNDLFINNININYSLADAIKATHERKFRLTEIHVAPKESRSEMGIKLNTSRLLRYIAISNKTAELLNNGWKIIGPRLDKVFFPCLIGKTLENTNCTICNSEFDKYELKLDCCEQFMCFECAEEYVQSRADNSEIFCPFCKGDPFGWNTID